MAMTMEKFEICTKATIDCMFSVEGNGYGHSHGGVGDLPLNATIDCLLTGREWL